MEKTAIFTDNDREAIGRIVISLHQHSGQSAAKYARSVGFDPADLSNLRGEKWRSNPTLIGEGKWIRLARLARYSTKKELAWQTATTEVYTYITTQLDVCQRYGFCNILVDRAGIGKTYACKEYARTHPNVFYLDCSSSKNVNVFIKALATAVGIEQSGTYNDILADTIFALQSLTNPLIILDEAGELNNKAYGVIKRIYNELEESCGIYVTGADGLRKHIERGITNEIVGFAELFSRLGKSYGSIAPSKSRDKNQERKYRDFIAEMAGQILEVNGVTGSTKEEILNRHAWKDLRAIKRAAIIAKANRLF